MAGEPVAREPGAGELVGRLRAAGCVYASDEAELLLATATTPVQLAEMVARRVAGEPLEHVLGWARLAGRRFAVGPGVFVPRRRSEFLLAEALRLGGSQPRPAPAGGPAVRLVVDLCCGCGAVGAVLASALAPVQLFAVDIDDAAVAYARRNLRATGAVVLPGDLFGPLPIDIRGRVDLLVANVPYIPAGQIRLLPGEARLHEPRVALDGGDDGLDVARRVIAQAPDWLAVGGHVLIETSAAQAAAAAVLVTDAGLTAQVTHDRDLDATVVSGGLTGPGQLATG